MSNNDLAAAPSGCLNCAYLASDSAGGDAQWDQSWPICEKFPRYSALKTFPFKKRMPCFRLGFWQSEFADQIVSGEHEEILRLMDLWAKKYPSSSIQIAKAR